MSKWLHKLDLQDIWKKYDSNDMTVSEIGKEIAERVRKLKCYKKYEDILEEIVLNFEFVEDLAEFNSFMNELYDWGDIKIGQQKGIFKDKLCWIATRF